MGCGSGGSRSTVSRLPLLTQWAAPLRLLSARAAQALERRMSCAGTVARSRGMEAEDCASSPAGETPTTRGRDRRGGVTSSGHNGLQWTQCNSSDKSSSSWSGVCMTRASAAPLLCSLISSLEQCSHQRLRADAAMCRRTGASAAALQGSDPSHRSRRSSPLAMR